MSEQQQDGDRHEWETPQPELTFDTPTFEPWASCPECRSEHTRLQMRELGDDATVWFQSNRVVWFKCSSCGNTSRPVAGDFVEQPDETEDYSLIEQFKRWLDAV